MAEYSIVSTTMNYNGIINELHYWKESITNCKDHVGIDQTRLKLSHTHTHAHTHTHIYIYHTLSNIYLFLPEPTSPILSPRSPIYDLVNRIRYVGIA